MADTTSVPGGSTFDAGKAEAFAGRFMQALNDGALCLMTSIGHRTGLFDAMRDQPPQTSREIASRARLNERYVREWLGAMVTSGVVSVDADSARYQLPAEHAAFLTRAAGADNMAVFAAVRCPEVMRLTPAPDRFRRRRGGDRPDGRPRQSAAPDRPYAG